MAYMTSDQERVAFDLEREYGTADRVMLESTIESYGLLWLRWHVAKEAQASSFPDRNLFIRPDGTRLTWQMQ